VSRLGLEAQREAVLTYLDGGRWSLVQECVEVESGKRNDRPHVMRNVLPVIREIQASGVKSLRGVARALAARGIATARGGAWTPVQVSAILHRVGDRGENKPGQLSDYQANNMPTPWRARSLKHGREREGPQSGNFLARVSEGCPMFACRRDPARGARSLKLAQKPIRLMPF
jgi:hypothetical protein